MEKRYIAIAHGRCPQEVTLEHFLAKKRAGVVVVQADHPGSQIARLHLRSVAQRQDLSLIEIKLETGRKHQIRAQLAAAGHPLLGDFRYGSRQQFDGRNLALHCFKLAVEHPTQGETIAQIAPPPPTWNALFKKEINMIISNNTP